MKKLLPLFALLLVVACGAGAGVHPKLGPKLGGLYPQTNQNRLTIAQGAAGTVTVATGCYITSCSAYGTGSSMSLTPTPCGPNVAASCTAQPAITIPAGIPISFVPPVDTTTNLGTMADKSTIVFSGTSNYWCNVYQYTP